MPQQDIQQNITFWLQGNPPDEQNQVTGKAKFVLFDSSLRFVGVDRQGAIYYYLTNGDYYNGVTFYKRYSKK